MNELKEQIDMNLQQIEKMEKFIALSLRRENIANEYAPLAEDTEKVRQLMLAAYQQLNDELESMEMEHAKLMNRMRQQQTVILDHLINRKRIEQQQEREIDEVENRILGSACSMGSINKKLVTGSARKGLAESSSKLQVNNGFTTPKMTISEYKQSPLVMRNRVNPIPLSFLEFEVQVTPKIFDSIPKYMRGRESVDELNDFLESIIIPCFNDKYKLQHRHRGSVRNRNDLELWKLYNEQATYLPGKFFITPGDISRKINKLLDKKLQNRITMLRHIGFLQEQRVSQTVCYIWSVNMK